MHEYACIPNIKRTPNEKYGFITFLLKSDMENSRLRIHNERIETMYKVVPIIPDLLIL